MAWSGIFYNGVWSCGFDMDPVAGEIFDITPNGSASATTPFGAGYSWTGASAQGKLFGVNLTHLVLGIRCQGPLPALGASAIILNFYDATAGASQVTLRVFGDGSMQFFLGSTTSTPIGSATGPSVFSPSTWTYLEVKLLIAASSGGSVELRVNGNATPVITQGSVTTKSTANTWISGVILTNANSTWFWDDWYMLDTTGTSPLDTYLGNIRIATDVANGAGAHTQFAPTTPTGVNYSNTSNIPAVTTKYNSDATPGDIDSYAFPAISGSPASVLFLNHWYMVELDSAGTRTVVPGCRSGGSDFFDSTPQTPPNGTYKRFNKPWTVDPNTSAAWTVANAQSAELSLKINT